MQLIQPTHALRPARGPLLLGTVVGSLLLVGGIGLAWVAMATPLIRGLAPAVVRPSPDQVALGALVWGMSLVLPPCFAIIGAIRLAVVANAMMRKPDVGAVGRALPSLGDEYMMAPSIRLPDGRSIRNIIVGPFGVAVIRELPAPRNTRRHGDAWEMRRADGRWAPMENPLDRSARDAERIRHWFAAEDRDFLVKVYAAVVVRDPSDARTPSCAAITADQIPAWLASLPPQRSLHGDRREDVVEMIRSIA